MRQLRDAWDADASSLQAVNNKTWTLLDTEMDAVLKTFAIDHGNIAAAAPAQRQRQLAVLPQDLQECGF